MTILLLGNTNNVYSDLDVEYDMLQIARVFELEGDRQILYGGVLESVVQSMMASIDVSADLDVGYSIRWYLWDDDDCIFGISVSQDTQSFVSSIDVSRDIESKYNIGVIDSLTNCPYSIREFLAFDLSSSYDLSLYKDYGDRSGTYGILVSSDLEASHNILEALADDLTALYWLKSEVESHTGIPYDITNRNIVEEDLRVLYTIYDPTSESIVTDVEITVDGIAIDVDDLSIVADLDSYCWTFTAELSAMADWILCPAGKTVQIRLGTDIYEMVIDSRVRKTVFGAGTFSIEGRSPTMKYGEGATPIHKTWDEVTAHNAVDELISSPDAEINIMDWTIPDGVLVSEGYNPITIVANIAKAAGGTLYTKAGGQLVLELGYKVAPPDYDINSTDHVFSDLDDIYEISESREITPGYNSVEVTNEPDTDVSSVNIEQVSLDYLTNTARIKIEVYPFVSSIVLLASHLGITITYDAVPVVETKEELIEIIDGSGSVTKPIKTLLSSSYQDNDLGAVVSKGTTITTTVPGNSLLSVSYETEYHMASVSSVDAEKVQIYMEE